MDLLYYLVLKTLFEKYLFISFSLYRNSLSFFQFYRESPIPGKILSLNILWLTWPIVAKITEQYYLNPPGGDLSKNWRHNTITELYSQANPIQVVWPTEIIVTQLASSIDTAITIHKLRHFLTVTDLYNYFSGNVPMDSYSNTPLSYRSELCLHEWGFSGSYKWQTFQYCRSNSSAIRSPVRLSFSCPTDMVGTIRLTLFKWYLWFGQNIGLSK